MLILVLNSGSSSIKFSMYEAASGSEPKVRLDGEVSGVGSDGAELALQVGDGGEQKSRVDATSAEVGIHAVLDAVSGAKVGKADAVGYRVVHPGAKLKGHQRITGEVLRELDEAAVFAPLHDPVAVQIIRAVIEADAAGGTLCVLRHGISRDDAEGGDDVSPAPGVQG